MRIFRNIVIWTAFVLTYWTTSYGQIRSNTADKSTVTAYTAKDSIFVFNDPKQGSLYAKSPFHSIATFEWTKYDTASNNFKFSIPIQADVNKDSSLVGNLSQGGYRVTIKTPGHPDTSYLAWVFLNKVLTHLKKDVNGHVPSGNVLCYSFTINDIVDDTTRFKTYIYYDTLDVLHKKIKLKNRLRFTWSANPPLNFPIPYHDTTAVFTIVRKGHLPIVKPPSKNTVFTVKVTDNFNFSQTDSIQYITKQTDAHFRATWEDPNGNQHNINAGDSISAPVKVAFIDSSERANYYQWMFPDINPDTATTKDPGIRYYYTPKTYTVSLITTNYNLCTDTFLISVKVMRGFIGPDSAARQRDSLTNVFVAGEGKPFRIFLATIGEFHITIFSRWGKIVYEFDGPAEQWNGWDGDIGNSKASPGIYYYVIQAKTFDPHPDPHFMHANGQYKGFFYLFRRE